MGRLEKLGIKSEYDYSPGLRDHMHYAVSVDRVKFNLKSPKNTKKHFTRVANAIIKDANKNDCLEKLALSVDKRYLGSLKGTVSDLVGVSEEHFNMRKDLPGWYKIVGATGTICGGIAGMIFGYGQMSEWATQASNYLNNQSYLLAPISAIAQFGISVLGTAASTALGGLAGVFSVVAPTLPFVKLQTPLAEKYKGYKSLGEALEKVKSKS